MNKYIRNIKIASTSLNMLVFARKNKVNFYQFFLLPLFCHSGACSYTVIFAIRSLLEAEASRHDGDRAVP